MGLRRKKFGDFSRVIELFEAEQRVFELLQTRSGDYAGSEQAKFLQNLIFAHRVLVAALHVENLLAITRPVLQMNLKIDAVAPLVSERLELGILNNFYLVGCVQHRVAVNRFLRNLIDEEVGRAAERRHKTADSFALWSCCSVCKASRREASWHGLFGCGSYLRFRH